MEQQPLYDVIIVGAGLSGVGAAYHLQTNCPQKTYAVLEARATLGGTWDLFKYPGVRSDSDMFTLGYSFNLWNKEKSIGSGEAIWQYIKDTAEKFGIDKKIQFNQKVVKAEWTDAEKLWTLRIANSLDNSVRELRCRFLMMCSGYYDYSTGYNPDIAGSESFKGATIHPQKWDDTINYDNKNVVVIGSGATAITLVPEMAKRAKKVVMLQRSPTYIVNLPAIDKSVQFLNKFLPQNFTSALTRWRNILISVISYSLIRKYPQKAKEFFLNRIRKTMGDSYDMRHFTPKYNPWDQRLCVVPDNDLFKAIKSGKAEVITDTIKEITPHGILLNSGRELPADVIVKATGLKMQLLGGMEVIVNGKAVESAKSYCYRGVMLSGVPNFAFTFGYINASWTLKAELTFHYITRLLNYMDEHKYQTVLPKLDNETPEEVSLLALDAGYVKRAADILPKQGAHSPWIVYQNYLSDLRLLKRESVSDKWLEFGKG